MNRRVRFFFLIALLFGMLQAPKPTHAAPINLTNISCSSFTVELDPSSSILLLVDIPGFGLSVGTVFGPSRTYDLTIFNAGVPLPVGTVITIEYFFDASSFTLFSGPCTNPEFFSPCGVKLPVYGAAIVRAGNSLPGLVAPGGAQATNRDGAPVVLPNDSDKNGFDEMLIIDIDDGFFGLDVGGCDPLYVPQSAVQISYLTSLGEEALK
jgi:hypothetical protein